MTDIAIHVENLSKLYHIGARQERHATTSALLSARLHAIVAALKQATTLDEMRRFVGQGES